MDFVTVWQNKSLCWATLMWCCLQICIYCTNIVSIFTSNAQQESEEAYFLKCWIITRLLQGYFVVKILKKQKWVSSSQEVLVIYFDTSILIFWCINSLNLSCTGENKSCRIRHFKTTVRKNARTLWISSPPLPLNHLSFQNIFLALADTFYPEWLMI